MKLLSIRLHPFGRFADDSRSFSDSLVVIHGPNEHGKTTLRQAIWHALFTPTKLTKTALEASVGPWLPAPGGDFAQVTLAFEHAGESWTLEKRWGASASSRLTNGTTTLADAAKVQEKLTGMLAHSEATFRHVLFTGQSELEQTLHAIKAHAGAMRDIRDLLRAGADAAADVDEQKLRGLLESRIGKAFSRWDDVRGRPEPKNHQEAVGANAWKREVGEILESWYAWQARVSEHEGILALEREIDGVNREVATMEQAIATSDGFVKQFGGLRQGLTDRATFEERIRRLEPEVAALDAAFTGWLKAEAVVDAWRNAKTDLEDQLAKLEEELKTARQRHAGAATLEACTEIERAQKTWQDAAAEAAKHPHPGEPLLAEIARLEQAVKDGENKLAARALSWRVEIADGRTATVRQGDGSENPVVVAGEGAAGVAQGRVQIHSDGLTLKVESGEDDVESVFRALADDRARLAKQLEGCGVDTPAAARLRAEKHRDLESKAESAKQVFDSLLQKKPLEQWQADVSAIKALAATRDVASLEREIASVRKKLTDGGIEPGKHEQSLVHWKTRYGDHDSVARGLLEEKSKLAETRKQLEAAPSLPDGFESVAAFVGALDTAQAERSSAQQALTDVKSRLASLTERLGDRRSEEVAEEAEASARTFERTRARGRAYRRILTELDSIARGEDPGPMKDFGDTVVRHFDRITGGQAALEFDGQLPATVVRGAVELPADRLSHGGGGALALAVRLAMAKAYLREGGGFVMLDDPLVHFDPVRMAAAADLLREFSGQAQVIIFTCHDHHAERFRASSQPLG